MPIRRRIVTLLVTLLAAVMTSGSARAQDGALPPGPLRVRLIGGTDGGPTSPVAGAPVILGARFGTTDADGWTVFDGVPPGRTTLEVTVDGYAALRRPLDLAPGLREPLELTLRPAPTVRVGGTVVTEGPAVPLAGARVRLRPRECPAAIAGPAECVTDWAGTFRLDGVLPAGVYELEVSAAGTRATTRAVTLREGDNDLAVALPRQLERGTASVRVVDAATGAPVGGARVTLSEAWPTGEVATGTTDAAGACELRNLVLGTINTSADTLPATRRDLTVAVEAQGYAVAVAPVRVGAPLRVAIGRQAEQAEREPNPSPTFATPLVIGAAIRLAVTAKDDVDVFRFELPHPAQVTVALGPEVSLDAALAVQDGNGRDLARIRVAPQRNDARPATIALQLAAGRYFVLVHSWYRDHASEQAMTLRVGAEWAVDAFEPNDDAATARSVSANETLRGRIFPRGDEDGFRFVVTRPGRVRATSGPHPLDRRLRIARLGGQVLADVRVAPNTVGTVEALVEPGEFLLSTGVWYHDAASTRPYEITLSAISDDGVDDATPAAGPPRPVRTLDVGALTAATTFPVGDEDWYAVTVPGRGVLTVALVPPVDGRLAVHDPRGALLSDTRVPPGREGRTELEYDGPAVAFVRVGAWYNNLDSTTPYALRAWFTPADELDWQARNDTPETATPAELSEILRGTILPTRDRDHYGLQVDHPGRVRLHLSTPFDAGLWIQDAAGTKLGEWRVAPSATPTDFDVPVLPGGYVVGVRVWYDNQRTPSPYALRVDLLRADPVERVPMADDPPRFLRSGGAEAFAIEHLGDRDRFLFETVGAEPVHLRVTSPIDTRVKVVDDRTGAVVREARFTGPWSTEWTPTGPSRFRIELSAWYDNLWSLEPGWLFVDKESRTIPHARLDVRPDLENPREVTFLAAPVDGADAVRAHLDADGDGKDDLELALGKASVHTYADEGDRAYRLTVDGLAGRAAVIRGWVHAAGPRARRGVVVSLARPIEGEVVEKPFPLAVRAMSYSATRVTRVAVAVDGRAVGTLLSTPFNAELPWRELGAGSHVLSVTALDSDGNKASLQRTFRVSPYLDLSPRDGAVISGNDVRVRWTAHGFGPAVVRVRPRGETAWTEHVGEHGRDRVVVVKGLEAGRPYEFQPVGGDEAGPVRTLTRVAGLAFTRARYGATIARDYDQRLAVSVMNNGDAPLQVRLECGAPSDPLLLVGFVGEGSEDRPIALGPGQRREFLLGISAQDVLTARHRFSIRLTSDAGLTDEAAVEVDVRLPVVRLEWEDLGGAASGLGRRYRLRNAGDTITNLALYADTPSVTVSPAISHGLLAAGATLEVLAYPVLTEGFQKVEARIVARGLATEFSVPFVSALDPGESLFRVVLRPGEDARAAPDASAAALADARLLAADYLLPEDVDWASATPEADLDGDGLTDRWVVKSAENRIVWVGDDTDGDRTIDFVHADVGMDDTFEYSAFRLPTGAWQRTNLVEGWLEMGFALPWSRASYQRHDVDVVLNDTVIARLRDVLPEGNYTFRIPPAALVFGASGRPEGNRVAIRSKHLRGGHYVVNSDFRFRLRLTETPVWSAGRTAVEARERATQVQGLRLGGVDFSLSASRIRLSRPAPPPVGETVWLEVPVRNLGAARVDRLELALRQEGAEELARVRVTPVPLSGETIVRVPWQVRPGVTVLHLVLDPDGRIGDTDRRNDRATLSIEAAVPEVTPAAVTVVEPAPGASVAGPIVTVRAASAAGAPLELSIDGGLWEPLPPGVARLVLQPGEHTLAVRAVGTAQETRVAIRVTGTPLAPAIDEPAPGAELAARRVRVAFRCPPGSVLAGARAAGGPWIAAAIGDRGVATVELPLRFGPSSLDVMTVDARGLVGVASIDVRCTTQPAPDEPEGAVSASPPGWVTIADVGTMDFFTRWSGLARATK